MESAVRYDFSFPPKSSSNSLTQNTNCGSNNNGNQLTHTIHNVRQHHDSNKFNHNNNQTNNNVGLPKSASTSLLSCAASSNNLINNSAKSNQNNSYCNNCNNCTKIEMINNNNMMQNNLNMKNCIMGKAQQQHNVIKPSAMGLLQSQHMNTIHHTPQTPKDSNCSFSKISIYLLFLNIKINSLIKQIAFDDLKNTLAFMEDSPLIKQIDNSSQLVNNAVTNVPLMVNANTGNIGETGALSSSSSISSTSSSSCNSCCAPGYLP